MVRPILLMLMLAAVPAIQATATDVSVTGAPTDFRATPTDDGTLLTWNAPPGPEPEGYILTRISWDGHAETIHLAANETSYVTPEQGAVHAFFVVARFVDHESLPTHPILTGQYPWCTWAYTLNRPGGVPEGVVIRAGCLLPPPGTEQLWDKLEDTLGRPIDPNPIVITWGYANT